MSKNKTIETYRDGESDLPKGIGKPAIRALSNAGYLRLAQLTRLTETDVMQLHGVGPKAFNLLRQALAEKGLSFAGGSGREGN